MKLEPSEILFLISGVGIVAALPWLNFGGWMLWFLAKAFYFAGVGLFIREIYVRD